MDLQTADRLETEAFTKPKGIHVIRDPQGVCVVLVTDISISTALIDIGPNMEDEIEQTVARFQADMDAGARHA